MHAISKERVLNLDIKVLLWFDTEDYITPEADDAFLKLMTMLDKRGVRATFKMVGEKARVLRDRGRTDILSLLSGHEVGFHTDMHSFHPTVTEYLENFGFKDGAYEFEKREGQGFKDVTDITGQHSYCYGQAGASWGPQAFPVLKKWGIPCYLDVHDVVTVDGKPFWYGGLLNLTALHGIMRMALTRDGLDKAKEEYQELIKGMPPAKTAFVSIYYHPCEFSCTEFWDGVNFKRGINTPRSEWKGATLRPEGEMEFYIEQLGQFVDYILSQGNTEFITASQVLKYENQSKDPLNAEDIKALASRVNDSLYFVEYKGRTLSAADQFSLFCKYLLGKELEPDFMYGPENDIQTDSYGQVRVSELKNAISREFPKVFDFMMLPDYFEAGGIKINPADMACTLAKVIREGLSDEDSVNISKGNLRSQSHVNEEESWGNKWIIFPADLKVPNIIKMAKLQAWTLKPAIF